MEIGLKDRDGREIHEGDVVEFFAEYDDFGRVSYDTPTATRMVDVVKVVDGVAYFYNEEVQDGALAIRHNRYCRVVDRA